ALAGSVRRGVFDNDDLFIERCGADLVEDLPDRGGFVVDGDHDRQLHAVNQATVLRSPSSRPTRGAYPSAPRASSIEATESRTSPGRGGSWIGRRGEPVTRSSALTRSRRGVRSPQAML